MIIFGIRCVIRLQLSCCGSLRSGDSDKFRERRLTNITTFLWRLHDESEYQRGNSLSFLDGDTVQATVSAHYSTNFLITAPTKYPTPIRAHPLGKVSPESRITSECPLSPQPSPSPFPYSPVPRPFLSQTRYSDFNVTFTKPLSSRY